MFIICCDIFIINLNKSFHKWSKTHAFIDIFVTDIDECEDPNQCGNPETNHTTCLNIPGSFACPCQRGYTLDETTGQCKGMYSHISFHNWHQFLL